MSRRKARTLLVAAFSTILCASFARAGEIPPRMEALILGEDEQTVTPIKLAHVPFEAIGPFSKYPFVMWRADPTLPINLVRTYEGVKQWLELSSDVLGHQGLELFYDSTTQWLGEETWVYGLRVNGVAILDAKVEVHWDHGGIEGIVNAIPGEITSIQPPPTFLAPNKEWTYWSDRHPPFVDLKLGWLERTRTATAIETRIVDQDGVHLTRIAPFPQNAVGTDFQFTEYPTGNFPDQIGVEKSGKIWFSQPNNNLLTRFDPATATFSSVPTTGGSGPDGMIVDPLDRIWTGLYYSGQMGEYVISTNTFTAIPVPYAPSNPAIPLFSRSTHIWCTDHQNNRISECDPATATWLNSVVMPTPACWVVQGTEDAAHQTMYFSEYNVSQLGKKTWSGAPTDIVLPTGGCAFPVFYRSRVFYSNWNTDRMGVYNTTTGQIVEYSYPIANEIGGPICKTPSGQIVVGTRNIGYIMVFDTLTATFTAYKIPTAFAGLKDGITSDKQGVIWFTETGVNQLGKLVLP